MVSCKINAQAVAKIKLSRLQAKVQEWLAKGFGSAPFSFEIYSIRKPNGETICWEITVSALDIPRALPAALCGFVAGLEALADLI
jgi:hypothetical protein